MMRSLGFTSWLLAVLLVGGVAATAKDDKSKKGIPVKPVVSKKQPVQFVRVELPGDQRTLTLAEVEIYSGKANVARQGKARQSATSHGGVAGRAIDGNKSGNWSGGGQTHTPEGKPNPWWEVDLGKAVAVERIGIWNRTELHERLDYFTLIGLDANRQEVFKFAGLRAPTESVDIDLVEDTLKYAGGGVVSTTVVPPGYRDPEPFGFTKGDVVAIIGNGLADRMQHDAWMETCIQAASPGLELRFRNMSASGDRVDKWPRSKGFTPMGAYLQHVEADVVFVMFGYNESFDDKPDDYPAKLGRLVTQLRQWQPNGESLPRIVLFSPIAHENLEDPNLPDGRANNARLAAYTQATRKAAEANGVAFVDLYAPSLNFYLQDQQPLTINGVHLNAHGNRRIAEVIATQLVGKTVKASADLEPLREAVLDKNWCWHNRYRATDGNDVWGGRSGLRFVDNQSNAEVLKHELVMLDVMTANRDAKIWARASGGDLKVNDGNVPPPIEVISNVGGKSRSSNAGKEGNPELFVKGENAVATIAVREGYSVGLFADEVRFPGLVNPVQLQVDGKGRLWAAAWPTYPKWEPLKEMNDALLIFPDDDRDGKADRVIEFARVHNPLGFEFWNGGVVVTSGPDLLFLRDTDGDDKADERYVLFHGLGTSDTHHAANNLIYGPDGAIYWQSGIFLVNNFEHPWGASLNTGSSAMYRFDPRRYTIAAHAGNSPNPHGIAFDRWGYHYATDGTGGRAYQVRPSGNGFKMHKLLNKQVRPVPASEIVSSAQFPDDVQGDFLICNAIGYLGIKQYKLDRNAETGAVWGEPNGGKLEATMTLPNGSEHKTSSDGFLMSADKNFRPTDAIFGADGAMYVADWSNVIIGHMQHNIRDPNRDKTHGRIYRIVANGRPLQQDVAIDGQPIPKLLANLQHPVDGVRHRTRVELSEREPAAVIAATRKWMAQFDPKKKEDAHHLLEALWVHQQFNVRNEELLGQLLESPEPHARIAAKTVQHHWTAADPVKGGGAAVEETHLAATAKSGVLSDTPELTTIRIGTLPEKLKYDVEKLTVKAGKKIKLIFANPDFMPHNLVLVQPGKATEVGNLAVALGAKGFDKQWVPDSPDVIWSTKLVDHGSEEVVEFTAPTKPGNYQYVCTFPGHSLLMRGVLTVK